VLEAPARPVRPGETPATLPIGPRRSRILVDGLHATGGAGIDRSILPGVDRPSWIEGLDIADRVACCQLSKPED
jgi:hypothetical protein